MTVEQHSENTDRAFFHAVQAMQHVALSSDAGRARATIPIVGYDNVHPEKVRMLSEFEPFASALEPAEMWENYQQASEKAVTKLFCAVYKMIVDQESNILLN